MMPQLARWTREVGSKRATVIRMMMIDVDDGANHDDLAQVDAPIGPMHHENKIKIKK